MFERYARSARQALFYARYEAGNHGSRAIETEHVLLGVLSEDERTVDGLLARAQLSRESVLRETESRTAKWSLLTYSTEIPFSVESKRVIQFAIEEADRLGRPFVGAEHLLLALLRSKGTVAASILSDLGMRLKVAREGILAFPNDHLDAPT